MTTTTEASNAVRIGGREFIIAPPSGRKANQLLKMLRGLSKAQPELAKALAKFRRDYERENVIELDRVQAALRYPPRVLSRIDDDGEEQPIFDANAPGVPVFVPSPVDEISDEAWERAGHVYRVPRSPTMIEIGLALFDEALDTAEETVYRLVALLTFSNAEVAEWARSGALPDKLTERVDVLLDDGDVGDLLELAVVVSEVVDAQINAKLDELGGRAGKALDRVGRNRFRSRARTSDQATSPTGSTPSSSTDSDANTDGLPTSPSSSPTDSSSTSPSSESTSENSNSLPKATEQ